MRQGLADQRTEVEQLRAEITKWRQRVPKLAETLRLRADSLSHVERQNQHLREELASLRQQLAPESSSKVADQSAELSRENQRLVADRSRLAKAVVSLENRNQLLQQTVEILTIRLEDAVGEIGRLRESADRVLLHRSVSDHESVADNSRVLLRIRGIGEKTLGLLEQAGIHSLETLAELQEVSLDDPNSPLFPHRTRIRKQRWIAQARELALHLEPSRGP